MRAQARNHKYEKVSLFDRNFVVRYVYRVYMYIFVFPFCIYIYKTYLKYLSLHTFVFNHITSVVKLVHVLMPRSRI